MMIAIGKLPAGAIDPNARSNPEPVQIAQAGDTNCRQTNATTGVYQQPDPASFSPGSLPAEQTVRLEVLGTGTGWSRIREPIVGWVESQYLTPPTPCSLDSDNEPSATLFVQPESTATDPTGAGLSTLQPGSPESSLPVCEVQLPRGLAVLRPNPTSPPVTAIPPGVPYPFQLTGVTQTVGNQIFAYILAPVEGWIQIGTVGGAATLGGSDCV